MPGIVVQSGMTERPLVVIAGALSRKRKAKAEQLQDGIAKRWRLDGPGAAQQPRSEPVESRDVIPLLDGWIRRLEREAGLDQAQTR
jgi:hypothetical protein